MTATLTHELERRYDGPIPEWESPSENPAVKLRREMRTIRRMAIGYAKSACTHADRRDEAETARAHEFHKGNVERSLRNLAWARQCHSQQATQLGQLIRPRAV